jgi:N utilization substance protein B
MMQNNPEKKISPKRLAREYMVQALYQYQMSGGSLDAIIVQFQEQEKMIKPVYRMFKKYLCQITEHEEDILELLKPQVRSLEEVHILTLAILKLAIYELNYCFDVPYKVVINEAIELAKDFGIIDSAQFVNGVLDKIAPLCRTLECGTRPGAA